MAQNLKLSKTSKEYLFKVSTPFIPTKTFITKIWCDVLSGFSDVTNQIKYSKFNVDAIDVLNKYIKPDSTHTDLKLSKTSKEYLFKVDVPYTPTKTLVTKMQLDFVSAGLDITNRVNHSKFFVNTIDVLNKYIKPDSTHTDLKLSKTSKEYLFKVSTPFIPTKTFVTKVQYDVISSGLDVFNTVNISKLYTNVISYRNQMQAIHNSKIYIDVLDVVDLYTRPRNTYSSQFDGDYMYRQEIIIDTYDLTETLTDTLIGISLDSSMSDIFNRNVNVDQMDDFTSDSILSYKIHQNTDNLLYIDNTNNVLVFNSKQSEHAFVEIEIPVYRTFIITTRIKCPNANSGSTHAPGIGLQQDDDNNIIFKNKFESNNKEIHGYMHGEEILHTGESVNGSDDQIYYRICVYNTYISFENSIDGTDWEVFKQIHRSSSINVTPSNVIIGKGYYNKSVYNNSVQNNSLSTLGNDGTSYVDSIDLISQNDGQDVVVTGCDMITQIPHWLISQNPLMGEFVLACRIPELEPNKDNLLYIYYGNKENTNNHGNTLKLQKNDIVCYEVESDTYNNLPQLVDRKLYNHGVAKGLITTSKVSDGIGGKGISYNGTNDYFEINHNSELDIGSKNYHIIEFIAKLSTNQGGTILSKIGTDEYPDRYGYSVNIDKTTGRLSLIVAHEQGDIGDTVHESYQDSYNSIQDNEYHIFEIVINRDNDRATFFIDDTSVEVNYSGPTLNSKKQIYITSNKKLTIGCHNSIINFFSGWLGHIRLSSSSRKFGQLRYVKWMQKYIYPGSEQLVRMSDLILNCFIYMEIGKKTIYIGNEYKIVYYT